MGFTNKYFSNITNFKKITEALRIASSLPDKVDEKILEQLGYTNPADVLILRFFKELNFLKDDNTPTPLFEKFRDPEHSKEAFALGILEAYGDLFEEDPAIHLKSEEYITKLFETILGDEKSNIIIGYMVRTFKVLIDYAGPETINSVLEQNESEVSSKKENIQELTETVTESIDTVSKGNGTDTPVENKMNGQPSKGFVATKMKSNIAARNNVSTSTKETEYVNKAYIKRADLLYGLDRYEEALPALDQVFERFAQSDNAELYEQASDALIKRMNIAEVLQLDDELLPIYSKVIERLEDSENEKFVNHVEHALINLAEILLDKNQNDKALEVLDLAIKRLKNSQRNHEFLARAMYKRAELYELSGFDQEALDAIDEFLATFE